MIHDLWKNLITDVNELSNKIGLWHIKICHNPISIDTKLITLFVNE